MRDDATHLRGRQGPRHEGPNCKLRVLRNPWEVVNVCVCVCVTEITSVCWKDPSGCGVQVYEAFGGELEVGKASLRAGRVTSWWVSGMWQVL